MRRCALLLGIAIVLLAFCVGCGSTESDVVATVNNQPISRSQLCQALEQAEDIDARRVETEKLMVLQLIYEELSRRGLTVSQQDAMGLRRRVDTYFGGVFPASGTGGTLGVRTLDALVVRQLVRQEADKRGVSVSREDLDARLEGIKDYVLAATGKSFDAWLADTGQSEEDMTSRLSTEILKGRLVFTDEERKAYFEANKRRLETLPHNNESVIYREIILSSKEEAEAVRKELLAGGSGDTVTGEKFGEVAAEKTLDPLGRTRGGMAGWVVKGNTDDPRVEKALFEIAPGVVSEPLLIELPAPEEQEGAAAAPRPQFYRLVMIEKHITPGELTLEGNLDAIEEWMMGDPRYQPQLQEFFTNLRAKADIVVLSPRYKVLGDAYREGREARARRMSQTEELRPILPEPTGEVQPPGAEKTGPPAEAKPE
ncbi:MAG: peptidylprolyl isomerase [Armatimonadetes bacterium]|nr:peptidylprolyl isomerase [Armatimonadota bacterium]